MTERRTVRYASLELSRLLRVMRKDMVKGRQPTVDQANQIVEIAEDVKTLILEWKARQRLETRSSDASLAK